MDKKARDLLERSLSFFNQLPNQKSMKGSTYDLAAEISKHLLEPRTCEMVLVSTLNALRDMIETTTDELLTDLKDDVWDGDPRNGLREYALEQEQVLMERSIDEGYAVTFARESGSWKMGS